MPRLIDANKLDMYFLDKVFTKTNWAYYEIDEAIDAQPTIDAVEVVRCKDCKWCSVDRYVDGNVPDYVCINMDCGVEADGFCSWGERKEDEQI